jgi:Cache domain
MSISRRILLGFVLAQLASAALVSGWYFYILRPELVGLTRQRAQDSVVSSIEAIKEYLHPAETLAEAAHYLLVEDVISGDRPDKLERYFVAQLRARPEIAGLYIGYPDGAFFYVMKSDEESAGGTRTKTIRQGPEGREVELTWRDKDFSVVKQGFDAQDQYDPRTRDWYSAATTSEGQVWTEPYVFFTSGKPGITLADAIRGGDGTVSAVLGIDVEISEISGFLTRNSLGVRGSAYIVTEQGKVIAHSGAEPITLGGGQSGDAPRFRTISELGGVEGALDDRILEQFTQPSNSTRMAIWDTDLEGRNYFVAVGQMAEANWPWQVVLIAPSAIGQGAMHRVGTMFYVSILIALFLACAIGYLVSRNIGRPIELLRANARQARHGNIEVMEPVATSAKEIAETDDALHHLAKLFRARGGSTDPQHTD